MVKIKTMSNFPLYDSMIYKIPNKDLTKKQKDDFISKIKNIDNDGAECIYSLIRVFEIENGENDSGTFKLPYCGKYVKKNMKFDLEQLPNKLKQILYKFLLIHIKKMEEDAKITTI